MLHLMSTQQVDCSIRSSKDWVGAHCSHFSLFVFMWMRAFCFFIPLPFPSQLRWPETRVVVCTMLGRGLNFQNKTPAERQCGWGPRIHAVLSMISQKLSSLIPLAFRPWIRLYCYNRGCVLFEDVKSHRDDFKTAYYVYLLPVLSYLAVLRSSVPYIYRMYYHWQLTWTHLLYTVLVMSLLSYLWPANEAWAYID